MNTEYLPCEVRKEIEKFLSEKEDGVALIVRGKILRKGGDVHSPRQYFKLILCHSKKTTKAFWHSSRMNLFLNESNPWRNARKVGLSWTESFKTRIERLILNLAIEERIGTKNFELTFEPCQETHVKNILKIGVLRALYESKRTA
jgi:hypothetical protein